MSRKEITELLTDVLIKDKLSDRKYYAKEVSIDHGTTRVKRVDVMQFLPKGVFYVSDIEKGIFICYEIKSSYEDVYSGHGLNFLGDENYIVTTVETYKKLLPDIASGKLRKYVKEHFPESTLDFGIMLAIPSYIDCRIKKDLFAELENPTKFGGNARDWKIYKMLNGDGHGRRSRSLIEFLFCMLRAKHSATNFEK